LSIGQLTHTPRDDVVPRPAQNAQENKFCPGLIYRVWGVICITRPKSSNLSTIAEAAESSEPTALDNNNI